MTLIDGYDRRKVPGTAQYRPMTAQEARLLRPGQHVPFLSTNGKVYQAKVNGALRTWKRDPKRLEVPMKFGLKDCFTADARHDGTMNYLLVPVDVWGRDLTH